ncbi:MAG TPA: CoA transferase [Burkholderiaceae bacterium]|jgi:crotonobetainyl-CoA:carnitine CoA-transferase CaiB-like acyl-CoA transferase
MSDEPKQAQGPLTGLTVIDVGMIFAGPLVGTLLADLGATVIKIEHPDGDEVRRVGRFKNGEQLWWRVTARNKLLAAVDVKTKEGQEVLCRMVRGADVLVENFRPGRFAEWGLSYERLSQENRGLVLLHISGYGQTGPYSARPGMGTLAEAFSGFAHTIGPHDAPPSLPMFPIADGVAAITGAYAVLAALFERGRTGLGDEIDLSLYEPMLSLMGSMLIDYDQLNYVATRHGNRSNWSVPRNSYKTSDGKWVAVSSAANSVARRLFRAIGRDDLADDPALATNPQRVERIEECDGAIAEWVARHTQKQVLDRFLECEVVVGPICDVEQIFADPHVQARGTLVEVEDPVLGKVKVQGVVPRFKRNASSIRWLGKREVGADTADLLTRAGYSADEIAALETSGVVRLAPV